MKLWSRPHSLQRKIITAIVMVGLLPLTLSLVLTYLEERRALRETVGANFKEIAVEAARRIEIQVTRGINEAQQLATTPFVLTEANRSYAGKEEKKIDSTIGDWQRRWREREHRNEFPLFINRIVTNYLIRWHDIRKSDYVAILVTDNRGALVVSSIPQVEYYYGKSAWWQAVFDWGAGRVYVSDVYFDPSFGTHVLNVSVPILNDEPRAAAGAVSVLLRRDSLFQSISDVTIGATGHAMLMSSDGTPLICPGKSRAEGNRRHGPLRNLHGLCDDHVEAGCLEGGGRGARLQRAGLDSLSGSGRQHPHCNRGEPERQTVADLRPSEP